MVIVRREGFSNDQWQIDGSQSAQVNYNDAGVFASDPSEMVRPNNCRIRNAWRISNGRLLGDWQVDKALQRLPREAFDYVWMIDVPPYDPEIDDRA